MSRIAANENAEDYSGDEGSMTETVGGSPVPVVKEYVFKVVVLGNHGVGKTSLIQRLLQCAAAGRGKSNFTPLPPTTPTIGTDFSAVMVENVFPNRNVRLQLWDTAGLTKYAAGASTVFPHTSLILCVFDISVLETLRDVTERHLTAAAEFLPELEQANIFVVGNKLDLLDSPDAAVRDNQKRCAATDVSFLSAGDDESDLLTEDIPPDDDGAGAERFLGREGIVTSAEVRELLLDVFSEVHYGEVSSRSGAGVSALLTRLCRTMLLNEHALDEHQESETMLEEEEYTTLQHTSLPTAPLTSSVGMLAAAAEQQKRKRQQRQHEEMRDGARNTAKAAKTAGGDIRTTGLGGEEDEETQPFFDGRSESNTGKSSAAASGGSWQHSGFQFDMQASTNQPPPFMDNSTAIFSPASGLPSPVEQEHTNIPENRRPSPTVANNKTSSLTERRAKEKEEMEMLLRGKSLTANRGETDEPSYEPNDLDRPGADPSVQNTKGRPFHSVLDDRVPDRRPTRDSEDDNHGSSYGANEDEDSEAEAQRFKDLLSGRMRDIDTDAKLDRERRKLEEARHKRDKNFKKEKDDLPDIAKKYKKEKADSKCKCAVM